jgi:hypothetical protein
MGGHAANFPVLVQLSDRPMPLCLFARSLSKEAGLECPPGEHKNYSWAAQCWRWRLDRHEYSAVGAFWADAHRRRGARRIM